MGFHTVVVGYDGSSDADRAVDSAADQAGPDATVHVVTAFHPESSSQYAKHLQQIPEEYRYTYDPYAAEQERQDAALLRLRERGVSCRGTSSPTIRRPRSWTSPSVKRPISWSSAAVASVGCNGSFAAASRPGSLRTPR